MADNPKCDGNFALMMKLHEMVHRPLRFRSMRKIANIGIYESGAYRNDEAFVKPDDDTVRHHALSERSTAG